MAAASSQVGANPPPSSLPPRSPPMRRPLPLPWRKPGEFGADLILFHAYDTLVVAASETSGIRYYDYAAAARAEMHHLEPLAQRVREAGVRCEIVVRPGLAADQILAFLREREIDRIVMGTHSPGPIGKLLVGSVAEAVLRTARVPVYIVGPDVVDGAYRNFATRTILCAVSLHETSYVVAAFAADLAAQHNARLILQHVIRPQERAEVLAGRTIDQIEADLLSLVPARACKEDRRADHRGARRSDRGTALPVQGAAGRPDRAGRTGRIGLCRHYPPRRGLQGAGPRALPGHHALAGACWPSAESKVEKLIPPRSIWPAFFRITAIAGAGCSDREEVRPEAVHQFQRFASVCILPIGTFQRSIAPSCSTHGAFTGINSRLPWNLPRAPGILSARRRSIQPRLLK